MLPVVWAFATVLLVVNCLPTTSPPDPMWDFIVVGGGVSGCIVADILSASGHKTLLLESGPPGHAEHGGTDVPKAFEPYEAAYRRNLTLFDVPGEYHSIAWKMPQYNQPSTPWAYQANVLGGGGVVNGALTMVPPQTDFDDMARYNWSYQDINPHFKEILSYMPAVNVPSADGLRYLEAPSDVLRKALAYLNFTAMPLNEEPGHRTNTFNYPPVTAAEGKRVSTCLRFLPHEEARPNFKLATNAVAQRLLLSPGALGRATGLEYTLHDTHTLATLSPSGRVVLTAGALNSPRLLMASGIGPQKELEKLEAAGLGPERSAWVLSEGVGRDLSDHVYLRMKFALKGYKGFNYANISSDSIQQYMQALSGPLAQYGPVLAGYLASPFGKGVSDMEVFMEAYTECVPPHLCREDTFAVFLMLLSPQSKTSLVLNITENGTLGVCPASWADLYLSDPRDKQTMRWGIERIVTAMVGTYGEALELIQPSAATGGAYDTLVNSYTDSHMEGNHWAETCALDRCADPFTLQVENTQNIHVADASLMPHQLSSHPMLTVAAMARRAAELILVNSGIAACASNPQCHAEGLEGQCCPSFDAVMLSCCQAPRSPAWRSPLPGALPRGLLADKKIN